MAAQLRHISINANDVERGKAFYEQVFGWSFRPWGPPGFYLTDDAGVGCSLQGRREIEAGSAMFGVEATMAVDDVAAAAAAIEGAGGRIVGGPYDIPTVGRLIWFADPEGNLAGAMRYEEADDPSPVPGPDATGVMRWFAINADDVPRARDFYERVFGWAYEPWGPPGFYTVRNAGKSFNGGLQHRRELRPGARMRGFEISIGVADIRVFVKTLEAAGGRMTMQPVRLETVGTLGYFEDPEGNLIGVCQYETPTAFEVTYGDGYWIRSAAVTYPDGARLDRHDHPWAQLAFCNSGVMRVISRAGAWLSPPTRAIWLPAGVEHEILMKGQVATYFMYLAPELAEPLAAGPCVLEVAPLLRELILHILKRQMLHPGRPNEARLATVLVDLLAEARQLDLALPMPRDRRALAAAERLQAAPAESSSLAALARETGASLRTLQRLFPLETGLTLEAWRQKARLMHGLAELSSGAGVAAAAFGCGYESPSAFIAAFRRQFGVTPGRFPSA